MSDSPLLRTERLTLKPVGVSDLEDLCAIWGDPEFVRHITGKPFTAEECWFRLLRDIGHWAAIGYGNWAMRHAETGAFVGTVGILDFRRDIVPPLDAPELGWGVAPAFQGQGYGVEGVTAALAWADAQLPQDRTVCIIAPDNLPSLRLAGRVGYQPRGEALYKGQTILLLERPRATRAGA